MSTPSNTRNRSTLRSIILAMALFTILNLLFQFHLDDSMDVQLDDSMDEKGVEKKEGEKQENRLHKFIPLPDLVRAFEDMQCPNQTYPVVQVVNLTADRGEGRKIPKIIHQTGKTKCLTKPFYDGAKDWAFEGHSFYFHDNTAVDMLLGKTWLEFPHLQNAFECLKNAGGGEFVAI